MSDSELTIYTIGHSNHPVDKFLGLLNLHQIETVVDTRSHPHSRFSPHFNRKQLEVNLANEDIQYLFMGETLGGRPIEPELYDSQGYVLYGEIARTDRFQMAIETLKEMAGDNRIALLCSEENPSVCHRRLLIGRVLFEEGVSVFHIRGDGKLQTEAEIRDEEAKADQPALFEYEALDWKSIRPVAIKKD
jgi:uncharacterized protein (DUF488 family)